VRDLWLQKRYLSLINQLFGRCTICQHLRVDTIKIGGMPDLIEHKQNGYLAHPFATEDLPPGIAWVLESRQRRQVLSSRAREKVEQEFTLEKQARRYLSVFEPSTTTFKQS